MNDRALLKAALNHKECEKMPIDFGATAVTGIHVLCVEKLREYYGLDKHPVKVIEPYQMLGEIENDLTQVMGVSVSGILGKNTFFGFECKDYKPYMTLWGQEVLVPGNLNTTTGDNGSELIYPQGDITVEASGIMPSSGYYFDAIIRQKPINDSELCPNENLEEFTLVDDDTIEFYKEKLIQLVNSGKGIIVNLGGSGIGDVACIPGVGLKNPKGIRDISEWYISTSIRQNYIHSVFEKQTEIAIENFKRIHKAVGSMIDVVFVCGTDFGTQTSQFCSSETYDSLYAPYYRMMNDWIHCNTQWKTFKHSCGAIKSLLPNIIESGFDIINPVQFSASGMDAISLKKEFGKDIVFWGGGVDTQKTLPFGNPDQVRDEVLRQCEILRKGGGFVFNTVHNIQANTPIENITALVSTLHEIND